MARVTVFGAGAVGAYYGGCLQRGGHDVVFIARGANLAALHSHGLRVTGAMGSFELPDVVATDDPASSPSADLVLLCVKNYDLPDAAAGTISCGELFLTLQNG